MKKRKITGFKDSDWGQWLEEETKKQNREKAIYTAVSVAVILAAYITLILI